MDVERKSLLPSTSGEPSEEERERSPFDPVNPVDTSVHIRNLVRPFTVRNLQEHIRRTGEFGEKGFWIDKIKSHCFVTFETEDEATATIKALDGIRWPHGSPKVLAVDYALNDEMFRDTGGVMGLAPATESVTQPATVDQESLKVSESRRSESAEKEVKLKKQKRKEEKPKEKGERKKREQSPTKLLDDLFRKTKATPCIYWLPLTDEQVVAKECAREERLAERRKQRDEEIAKEERLREERRKERQERIGQQVTSPHRRSSPLRDQGQKPRSPRNTSRQSPLRRSPLRSPQRRPYRVHSPSGGPLTKRS